MTWRRNNNNTCQYKELKRRRKRREVWEQLMTINGSLLRRITIITKKEIKVMEVEMECSTLVMIKMLKRLKGKQILLTKMKLLIIITNHKNKMMTGVKMMDK
jgi:hypothetical protein